MSAITLGAGLCHELPRGSSVRRVALDTDTGNSSPGIIDDVEDFPSAPDYDHTQMDWRQAAGKVDLRGSSTIRADGIGTGRRPPLDRRRVAIANDVVYLGQITFAVKNNQAGPS